jgi:hypothetical protein
MYCIVNARFEIWLILYPSCAYRALSLSAFKQATTVRYNRGSTPRSWTLFHTHRQYRPITGHLCIAIFSNVM